jgi:dTDP-4-amino-4,6-dideoxygalactose transaminase
MIKLSKSCIGDIEKQAVMKVLDNEYLGMGLNTKRFESALSDFFGRPAICVSSGTAALHLALQAIDVGYGDEVLVQSMTYVASFQAVSATGAVPIPCDIDSKTLCINLHDAEQRLTKKTKAIMPVHYSGGVGALDEVYSFAKKYNLRVVEDAAHAFGTEYQGKLIGGFGDIACFSFDGIKNITSGEGGCVVSNDDKILNKIKDARLLGVEKDSEKRYSGKRSWNFNVSNQGWRYHMSDIMAAIGIVQLNRFDELKSKRRALAKKYDEILSKHPTINLLDHNYSQVVPHIYVTRFNRNIDRENVKDALSELSIQMI